MTRLLLLLIAVVLALHAKKLNKVGFRDDDYDLSNFYKNHASDGPEPPGVARRTEDNYDELCKELCEEGKGGALCICGDMPPAGPA